MVLSAENIGTSRIDRGPVPLSILIGGNREKTKTKIDDFRVMAIVP